MHLYPTNPSKLRLPNPYVVDPAAITQLGFLGRSFDTISYDEGCEEEPTNMPNIYITLATGQEPPPPQATDQRYSFIEILARCTIAPDEATAEESGHLIVTNDQQSLIDENQVDIQNLQRQMCDVKKRYKARMMKLEKEYGLKLRLDKDLRLPKPNPSSPPKGLHVLRRVKNRQHLKSDERSNYSMPQLSTISNISTLVEPGVTPSVESLTDQESNDAKTRLDTDRNYRAKKRMDRSGTRESSSEAAVEHLEAHRLREDLADDDNFPNTKYLSKRKRLSGHLSLKKQRLAISSLSERPDALDRAFVLPAVKKDIGLTSVPQGSTTTEMVRSLSPETAEPQNRKHEQLGVFNTKQQARLSGQSFNLRSSWILASRVFAAQGKKVTCSDTINQILITDSNRPISWPRSRRWRKSLGVSVKALTDNFDRLTTAQPANSDPS